MNTKIEAKLDVAFKLADANTEYGEEEAKAMMVARIALLELIKAEGTSDINRLRAIELMIATARNP